MANVTYDIPIDGVGQGGKRYHLPVKTSQALYTGTMISQQFADGLIVPTTTAASGRVIGKYVGATIASASAGQRAEFETGREFLFTNGATTNAFSEASLWGSPAYAADDHTVYDNSNGDTLPFAGFFRGMEADGKVKVFIPGDDITGIDANEAAAGSDVVLSLRARNIVNGNVADLAAYTVASNAAVNDATLNVEGDVVLLVAQSTAAQNGLYTVGVVTTGAAPLTRHPLMFTGKVFRADDYDITVAAGTVFAHTRWFNSAAGTIGTNTQSFVPECVVIAQALVAGTMTLTSVPILSATKTSFLAHRKTANTATATTGGYHINGTATAGALGTASVEVFATVAAGTINVADISTLHITITNR
jgi:hypothetical protein